MLKSNCTYGSFRKLGVPYFGVLIIRIPTISGTILGSPILGFELQAFKQLRKGSVVLKDAREDPESRSP